MRALSPLITTGRSINLGNSTIASMSASAEDSLVRPYGYAIGIDWTRRDLQNDAKKTGRPWDTGKAFDSSATLGPIHPRSTVGELSSGEIWLSVNGELRQRGDLADLIWNNAEIIAELSSLFELRQGDLIYTGTPAGVAPVVHGDRLAAGISGLGSIQLEIR